MRPAYAPRLARNGEPARPVRCASADAQAGHQRAQRQPEADERRPRRTGPRRRSARPRSSTFCPSRASDVRDREDQERPEPVDAGGASSTGARPGAAGRSRAAPAGRPRPGPPSATPRTRRQGLGGAIQAPKPPDPAHGEDGDHDEADELVELGHAGRSYDGGGPGVARLAVAAVLVQPPRQVEALPARTPARSPPRPGLSSSTPSRSSIFARPGRSPNCAEQLARAA